MWSLRERVHRIRAVLSDAGGAGRAGGAEHRDVVEWTRQALVFRQLPWLRCGSRNFRGEKPRMFAESVIKD